MDLDKSNDYSVLCNFCAAEGNSCQAVNTRRAELLQRLYAVSHITCRREVIAARVPRGIGKDPDGPLSGASGTLATNHGAKLRLAERRPAVLPPVGVESDFSQ